MTSGTVDAAKLKDSLQSALDTAHGAGQITVEGDLTTGFELKVSAGRKVMAAPPK